MREPAKDRRIRRTHRLLKQGLAELMSEKEFNDISVRDITDRVDMNRSTFYLHYSDTYDLLQKLEADTLNDVQSMIDKFKSEVRVGKSLQPMFEPILDYIIENKDVCRSLFVNNASSNFIDKVYDLIYKNGIEIIYASYPSVSDEKFQYLIGFITYGLIGLIKKWFDTNMREGKAEILKLADIMVTASAESILVDSRTL